MGYIEQVLNLPYAVFWLPGLVFMAIVGGTFWLTRQGTPVTAGQSIEVTAEKPLKAPSSAEQRVAYRRNGNPVQVQVAWSDDKTDPRPGCVLDRSVGGMRLAIYEEAPEGTVLSIRPLHAEHMVPWVDLEVRSCRSSTELSGLYEVGCRYVKSPPYSIQLLFG